MSENPVIQIKLEHISKRFIHHWIFKELDLTLNNQDKLVIKGGNGSGKSTLLQIIAGYQSPTKGKITFTINGKTEENENIFRLLTIAAPYLELIEDFSFSESIAHQQLFKPFKRNLTNDAIIRASGISLSDAQKPLSTFSSGMKQRAKLTLAILADSPLLLLDEPCSNLDKNGIQWYREMIQIYGKEKTIVVCSNDQTHEFDFCEREISIEKFKNTSINH